MNNKVFVSKVEIKNAYGISNAVIEPGAVTVIEGKNNLGKTSLINALQSALLGGNDKSLLKNGEESGEVIVTFTDDVVATRKFTKKTNRLEVTKNGDPVPEPQTFLNNEYLSSIGSNPLKLLTASKSERTKMFLDALPLDVDVKKLEEVIERQVDVVDGEHGIITLDRVRKTLYDDRRVTNRLISEKEKTIKTLKKSSIENADELVDELKQVICGLQKRRDNILGSESEAVIKEEHKVADSIREIKQRGASLEVKIDAARSCLQSDIDQVNRDMEDQIRAIRESAAAQIAQLKEDARTKVESERSELARIPDEISRAQMEGNYAVQSAKTEFSQSLKDITNELQSKNDQLDAAKIDVNRNLEIQQYEAELSELKLEVDQINDAMSGLDNYKLGLLKGIDISGFDYVDGMILIDGVHFDAVNTARLMDVAIDLARLQSPKLGLMCIDGAESLDDESFAVFIQKAKESNMHLIVTKVTQGDQIQITEAA